jgi:hypothetical protein
LALNKDYIADTKDKIKHIEKDLKSQSKNYQTYLDKKLNQEVLKQPVKVLKDKLHDKIQYNHNRLDRLKVKLAKLENIKATGNVQLCFGSNKLFRQQFEIKKPNNLTLYKNHQQWYAEYSYQRNKEVTLVGSKDETAGNQEAQITHIQNNLFKLKLNINHKAKKKIDKYMEVNFTVNYEEATLKQIIKNNVGKDKTLWQALTYKLIKQKDKHKATQYVVAISFEKHLVKVPFISNINNGMIGVDINQDHLAVSDLDSKGNLLNVYKFNYDLNGNQHQNSNSISLAVKELILLAIKLNKPLSIEELDFTQKKKSLSLNKDQTKYNKNRNKQ